MDMSKLNHTISVDSETGEYWDGQRALTKHAQFNSVIKKASTGRLAGNVGAVPVRDLFQMLVLKIIFMIAVYFEVESLGLM